MQVEVILFDWGGTLTSVDRQAAALRRGAVRAAEIIGNSVGKSLVRQLIEEGRDNELSDLIRAHERDGMQSFTKSLLVLIQKEFVDPRVAYEMAPNVDELKMQMKGISTSHAGLLGG